MLLGLEPHFDQNLQHYHILECHHTTLQYTTALGQDRKICPFHVFCHLSIDLHIDCHLLLKRTPLITTKIECWHSYVYILEIHLEYFAIYITVLAKNFGC